MTTTASSSIDIASLPTIVQENLPLALEGKFHYIDGAFVKPAGTTFVDTHCPATGKVICALPNATAEEIASAFIAADRERLTFAKASVETRITILEKFAALIESSAKRLAVVETFDCGKPLRESEADMGDAVLCINHFIHLLKTTSFVDEKGSTDDLAVKVCWEAVGVFALITPWNFPFLMALQKVATAIAAGCPSVLKPSEYAAFTCIEMAGLLDQIPELPKGAFSLLIGTGAEVGNQMIQNKHVRKVSFTGSVPTGKHIMKTCADRLCPVHLELGGKSPAIVFDDADVDTALDWIQMGIYWGAGQVCTATSRLLVQEGIFDSFVSKLKACAERIVVGDGLAEGTMMGPLVSPMQYEKVKGYIRHGIEAEGLSLLYGGLEFPEKLSTSEENKTGFFLRPTAFINVPTSSKLWVEEIFGPVLCIRSFKTEEEAVALANASEYGLGGAVMTKDAALAERVAAAVESGSMWINCNQPVPMVLGTPFGGFKQSGFGKEMGKEGFFEYLQPKAVISAKKVGFNFECYPKPE